MSFCNRSQKTSLCVKNKQSWHLTLSWTILLCFLHAMTSSVIYFSAEMKPIC